MTSDSEEFDPAQHAHRRYNPLTEEYIVVSPHRTRRPWLGQVEPSHSLTLPTYDPTCYLCPGNKRMGGTSNPHYTSIYTFPNDFAALSSTAVMTSTTHTHNHPLLSTYPVHGYCDVICFHPRHDLTIAKLTTADITHIIDEWASLYRKRSMSEGIEYVQIFENKGAMMGCSNPHPHGQVWSMSDIPSIPLKELSALKRYASAGVAVENGLNNISELPCLLCDYAGLEESSVRLVLKNDYWLAIVPWWATWPFEILLLPFRHVNSILDMREEERQTLASILSEVTIRYDNLFSCSFAYSMGIHQAPVSNEATRLKNLPEENHDLAHMHFHFLPPLLRSASVRKFLVGFELMAEAQRDLTPEQAAERLRGCPSRHYTEAVE